MGRLSYIDENVKLFWSPGKAGGLPRLVMGVPEAILFASEAHAREIFKVGLMCEPTPDHDSAKMANALIDAIPLTAGIEDPEEQQAGPGTVL